MDVDAETRTAAAAKAAATAGRRGRIVAIGNLKGGTGKSTLAVNVAAAMARSGRKVALVDTDPQATSAEWLDNSALAIHAERLRIDGLEDLQAPLRTIDDLVAGHDVVLIDLPAVVAPAMASAFLLAHVILVPVSTSAVDIAGTRRVLNHVRHAARERGDWHPKVLLVPTRVSPKRRTGRLLEAAYRSLDLAVGPPVRERHVFQEAFTRGDWVGGQAPGSPAENDIMAVVETVDRLLAETGDPPALLGGGHAPEPTASDAAVTEAEADGDSPDALESAATASPGSPSADEPAGEAGDDMPAVLAEEPGSKRVRSIWSKRQRFRRLAWIAGLIGLAATLAVLLPGLDPSALAIRELMGAAVVLGLAFILPYGLVRLAWRQTKRRNELEF